MKNSFRFCGASGDFFGAMICTLFPSVIDVSATMCGILEATFTGLGTLCPYITSVCSECDLPYSVHDVKKHSVEINDVIDEILGPLDDALKQVENFKNETSKLISASIDILYDSPVITARYV